jgi:hypothetical protein
MAGPRPIAVTIIAVLAAIAGVLQIVSGLSLIFAWEVGSVWQGTIDIFVGLLVLVTGLALLQGNPLARTVATVVLILSIVAAVITAFAVTPGWTWAVGVGAGVLALVGLILLWTPRSSQWFKRG